MDNTILNTIKKKSETRRFYLPGIPDSLASILLIIFVLSNICNWLNWDKQTMIEKKMLQCR